MLRLLYPIILSFLSVLLCSCASPWQTISTGTSLQVDHEKVLLISPDTTFSCGFYPSGNGTNAFYFSIWFTHSTDKTVVWTANRRFPVNGQRSRISLNHQGNLVLTDVNGSTAWESSTSWGKHTTVALLDTGNLVINASIDKIIWQSFDSPTNTLLSSQHLTRENRLVSPSDYHVLYFDNDNVLRLLYNGQEITSIYWPSPDYNALQNGRTRFNSSKIAVLDHKGNFLSSDGFRMVASDLGLGIQRRITIDYDGNFRMYSLNASNGNWTITGEGVQQMCYVHGLCGRNGICEYSPRRPSCTCPPGYKMVDPENWNKGCKQTFSIDCGQPHGDFTFIKVPHGDFYGFDLASNKSISFEECTQICLESCLCISFTYKGGEGLCYTKNLLYNGQIYPYFSGDSYFKLPKNASSTFSASKHPGIMACRPEKSTVMLVSADAYSKDSDNISWAYFYTFAAILGAVELLFIMTGWYVLFKMHNIPSSVEEGYKMITNQFRRFTYRELVEATGKFKEELGKGGNGVVYRGILGDKKVVAVKKLTDVRKGEDEFWAEVTLIGRINHMNLVRMYGFCSEGQHRLLVYEFIENESLDRCLFYDRGTEGLLSWSQRFKIALGTARGLAYLHHECLEWIVHCDVKPENILLTREFEAKIADFGLSKLSKRDSSSLNFTHMRGTMGYMAPEWVLNSPIDAKVDVYSYGVVLLEIVTGSRVSSEVKVGEEEIDSMHFSGGAIEGREEMGLMQFVQAVKQMLASGADLDIVDARLKGHFNHEQAMAMVKIAVSCLDERSKRPTMDQITKDLMVYHDEDYHPAYF